MPSHGRFRRVAFRVPWTERFGSNSVGSATWKSLVDTVEQCGGAVVTMREKPILRWPGF
jgi:hypothetical protein